MTVAACEISAIRYSAWSGSVSHSDDQCRGRSDPSVPVQAYRGGCPLGNRVAPWVAYLVRAEGHIWRPEAKLGRNQLQVARATSNTEQVYVWST